MTIPAHPFLAAATASRAYQAPMTAVRMEREWVIVVHPIGASRHSEIFGLISNVQESI